MDRQVLVEGGAGGIVGFYRVCVIDQILPHAPADHVRRITSSLTVA